MSTITISGASGFPDSAMRRAVQQAAKAKQRLTVPASRADGTARAEPQPAQTP